MSVDDDCAYDRREARTEDDVLAWLDAAPDDEVPSPESLGVDWHADGWFTSYLRQLKAVARPRRRHLVRIAASVAEDKRRHPGKYCPARRCLWRTDGTHCPRHVRPAEAQSGTDRRPLRHT